MLSVRGNGEVKYQASGEPPDPVVLFDLAGINVDQARLLGDLLPTFASLEWDYYDVRREQIGIIKRSLGDKADQFAQSFIEYYKGT